VTVALPGARHVEHVMGMPVVVDVRDEHVDDGVLDAMFDWLRFVDSTSSTFEDDSEISRINRGELALEHPHRDVRWVLAHCEELRTATGGYFDARATADGDGVDPSSLVKGWSVERAAGMLEAAGIDRGLRHGRRPRAALHRAFERLRGDDHPLRRHRSLHAGLSAGERLIQRGVELRAPFGHTHVQRELIACGAGRVAHRHARGWLAQLRTDLDPARVRKPAKGKARSLDRGSDGGAARGRDARHVAPRSSHGHWRPAPDRPDPIAVLEQQSVTRVPELVPIRYGRMLVSPFTFYRGAAAIMAADLAPTPRSYVNVQLCGDAHLSNFGVFGSHERIMEFVRREVAENRLRMKEAKRAEKDVAKARTRDSLRVLAKRADEIEGELRIVAEPSLVVPLEDLLSPGAERDEIVKWMGRLVSRYRRSLSDHHHPIEEFEYVHGARKVVGVGSVGTHAWIHLFVGRDERDPLFLQSKEAQSSVLEPYVGRSEHRHHGRRVVAGQRLMQVASDIFLGWLRVKGIDGVPRDYYVRQLHDWKGAVESERLLVRGATLYARLCGATLARAHARWGDRIAIASYLGKGDAFERSIALFAVAYADQNDRDHEAFVAAVNSGLIAAEARL
jgi:hypothetical protein